jgi:hypothetical protein
MWFTIQWTFLTTHDNQLMQKNLILWKLNYIWMKILNDIACHLSWIEFQILNLNLNKWKGIWLKRIGMQINEESIEKLLVNMVLEQPIYFKT